MARRTPEDPATTRYLEEKMNMMKPAPVTYTIRALSEGGYTLSTSKEPLREGDRYPSAGWAGDLPGLIEKLQEMERERIEKTNEVTVREAIEALPLGDYRVAAEALETMGLDFRKFMPMPVEKADD